MIRRQWIRLAALMPTIAAADIAIAAAATAATAAITAAAVARALQQQEARLLEAEARLLEAEARLLEAEAIIKDLVRATEFNHVYIWQKGHPDEPRNGRLLERVENLLGHQLPRLLARPRFIPRDVAWQLNTVQFPPGA